MIQIRESTSRVRVCESRAHPVFNQSSGGSFPFYAISVAFARWNFLLHAAKKNNNAAKFFVSLKQNNSEGFIIHWCTIKFLALQRDQIYVSTLNIRGL